MPSFQLDGHKVTSGSYPFYRLVAAAFTVSGIVQTFFDVPRSLYEMASPILWVTHITTLVLGGAIIFLSLTAVRLTPQARLTLERVGIILSLTAVATYLTAIIGFNGIPRGTGVWVLIAFGAYLGYRFVEIHKILKLVGLR